MKAHLNPFAPNRVQRLLPFDPLLAGSSWDSIESDWEQLDRRAAVIGHHGSGKTTFLETFRTRLEKDWQIVSLFYNRNNRELSPYDRKLLLNLTSPEKTIVLIDGEGHLKVNERIWLRRFTRDCAGYLVARHHRSCLPTLLKLNSSPTLALELLARINLENPEAAQKQLPKILKKKRGNLRETWLTLYDYYAS